MSSCAGNRRFAGPFAMLVSIAYRREDGSPVALEDRCVHRLAPRSLGHVEGTALCGAGGEVIHSHIFGQSSFATHALVHERNLVKVDKDLPLELLGPLGCGIQTGAGTILNVLKPAPASSVAIIGAGAVGSSAIMAARLAGVVNIIAIDLNHDRLAFALRLGAKHGFDPSAVDMPTMAQAAGCDAGFDYIVDTTGNPNVVSKAIPTWRHAAKWRLWVPIHRCRSALTLRS